MAVSKVEQSRAKTGGRAKGVPNKQTAAVKDMILAALDKAGGVKYLTAQANENPKAFMSLVGRVLPLQVTGAGENGEHVFEVIERRIVRPK